MKVYHGSYTAIDEIDLNRCEVGKDFGKVFMLQNYTNKQSFGQNEKEEQNVLKKLPNFSKKIGLKYTNS